jgi:hypothetical protein
MGIILSTTNAIQDIIGLLILSNGQNSGMKRLVGILYTFSEIIQHDSRLDELDPILSK